MPRDVAIVLAEGTPGPIKKFLADQLNTLGLNVDHSVTASIITVHVPDPMLESHAAHSLGDIELRLREGATLKMSEQDHPMRAFSSVANRSDFAQSSGGGLFSMAERAFIGIHYLDEHLRCDDKLWSAALVASGRSDAAKTPERSWLIGPGESWTDQPLLGALSHLGYLEAVAPLHGPDHHSSVGLPLAASQWKAWVRRAAKGDLVSIDGIRGYWGEGVAYYFAWQTFYLKSLTFPAVLGLIVWALRPASITVDDDPNASLFSIIAVVWGLVFVTRWQSRESELAFRWGTAASHRSQQLRADYVGEKMVDPVTGELRLHDPPASRARRYALSVTLTGLSLLVPVAAMIASLNLQGYIVASTGAWMGVPVYVPLLAQFAAPGALFDPMQDNPLLPLVPVILHAITIQLLNAAFKGVAHALTRMENHRTQQTYDSSMLFKRFAFEASDCYLALFYIAFELRDVPKLRAELVALFTADTVRRVLLETIVPMALSWRSVLATSASRRTEVRDTSEEALRAELELEPYEDFDDYLEMVIQLGYVVLFASAFPLAPAICVVCNAVELIADSVKLAYVHRRPRPVRASSIGGWTACCYVLAIASIYTNLFIMGVASDQMAVVFPSMFEVPRSVAVSKGDGLHLKVLRAIGIFRGPAITSGEYEMRDGMGRFVVLLLGVIEHALLLVLLVAQLFLTQPPSWVRLVTARRNHEERMRPAGA